MSKNPDFELLSRHLAKELPEREASQVERLIASDSEWAAAWRLLNQLQTVGRDLDRATVQSMSELASRLFADYQQRLNKNDERLGIRVFDSQVMPVPEGVRPASVETRRLRYRLDDLELEMSLYPLTPESYELMGQLEGLQQNTPLTVTLTQGRRRTKARADQFHLFRFERVEAGKCRLALESPDGVIGHIDLEL